MARESVIEEYLTAVVRACGGEVRKVKWIGRRNAPDRFVMLPKSSWGDGPWSCWVELKATGKKPTTGQLREHERMRAAGLEVYVIDSFAGVDMLIG